MGEPFAYLLLGVVPGAWCPLWPCRLRLPSSQYLHGSARRTIHEENCYTQRPSVR